MALPGPAAAAALLRPEQRHRRRLAIEGRAEVGMEGWGVGLIRGWISAALSAETTSGWRMHPFLEAQELVSRMAQLLSGFKVQQL